MFIGNFHNLDHNSDETPVVLAAGRSSTSEMPNRGDKRILAEQAHKKRISGLKKDGGKGKTGGNGQIHHSRWKVPFIEALQRTMAQRSLPSGNVVDEETTSNILNDLKTNCVQEFTQLYQEASDAVWLDKMKKSSLVDQTRVLIMGGFVCKILPSWIWKGIESIP